MVQRKKNEKGGKEDINIDRFAGRRKERKRKERKKQTNQEATEQVNKYSKQRKTTTRNLFTVT